MSTFNNLLSAIGDKLQFSKNGGLIKWATDHFEAKDNADSDYARLKIAKGTDNEDAVRMDQLIAISESGKGGVKRLVFCMNANGANITAMTNGMLSIGAIINRVQVVVGSAFDGTIPADFNMTMTDEDETVIFELADFDPSDVDSVQEKDVNYIVGDNGIDVSINMPITGGTTGDAMVYIEYTEPVYYKILTDSKFIFTPSRKVAHIDCDCEDGETMTIIIGTTGVVCGNVAGNFVFDINNVTGQTHTFTAVGEEYVFTLNGNEYVIINETEEV